MRILYAEDNKTLREMYKGIMESLGHEVHAFENGIKAFDYLTQNQIDTLITDNRMPVMTGLELTKKAREFGYEGPIILISMDDNLERKAMEAGASRFVDKCESSRLLATLIGLSKGVEA